MSRQSDAKSGSTSVYRQSVTPPQRANRVATRVADRIAARRRWMLACAVECACVMTASKIHLNALRAFGGRTAMHNADSRSPVSTDGATTTAEMAGVCPRRENGKPHCVKHHTGGGVSYDRSGNVQRISTQLQCCWCGKLWNLDTEVTPRPPEEHGHALMPGVS